MANDYIIVTRTNRPQLGNQAIRAANLLKELRELIDGLNDAGQHMNDGSTYTTLEAQFGLSAGAGANFLSLVDTINTLLNKNTDVTGANRLSQLDEFQSRLAGQ